MKTQPELDKEWLQIEVVDGRACPERSACTVDYALCGPKKQKNEHGFCIPLVDSKFPYSWYICSYRFGSVLRIWLYIHIHIYICVCVCVRAQVVLAAFSHGGSVSVDMFITIKMFLNLFNSNLMLFTSHF